MGKEVKKKKLAVIREYSRALTDVRETNARQERPCVS